MAMVQNYIKTSLKIVVAQICHNMGWHAIQTTPLDLLVDILHRYMEELGKTAHRYSEQFGRTEPNLDDLGLAFKDIGILLVELEDFVNNVEPVPFVQDVPKIPIAKPNHLNCPKNGSREVLTRPEWIDEHLPLMNPEAEDEVGVESPSPTTDGFNRKPGIETGDIQGLRRPLEVIGANGVPFKRPRLFPDDEGCPMRDGVSVSLTLTGDVIVDGRQPDSKAPKFYDEIRSSSSSHSPEQSTEQVADPWKDGKKDLKKTDKVKLKNKKDKGKLIKKKNGKKEKVKNSSKKNRDKNKEGKKLKLITDSMLNNVERGPDGKFKKVKLLKSKPLIIKTKKGIKTGTEKSNKTKKKSQTLNIPSSLFAPAHKLSKSPKSSKQSPLSTSTLAIKAPKIEKISPLAQLASILSKSDDNSSGELGTETKSDISAGFSGEDSPERLVIDDNPVSVDNIQRESRLAAVNDSINTVIMKGLEVTAKAREESSRSYHETIEDVIRQATETPIKTEPRDVYDFTDDDLSPPTTPATPEGLAAVLSPPKKKPRVSEPEMGKKVRDKIKEKIKKKSKEPKLKTKCPFPKFDDNEQPQDFSRTSENPPQSPMAAAMPEPDNGVSFHQAPYSQMLHLPYFSQIPKVPPALLPYPSSIPPMLPLPFQSHIPPNMPMPPVGFYVRNPRPETGNPRFNEPLPPPPPMPVVPQQPIISNPPEVKKRDVFVQPKVELTDEIDKGKASQYKKEKEKKEGEDEDAEKLKSKKKKEKGKEKKKNADAGGTEKGQSKSGKGNKEKTPKSKDKSKKNEKKKKDEKTKDDTSTIPRITLKLGGNAAQSEGTKIVLKLKLPKPNPTSPFAASLPAPVFQHPWSAKSSSSATARAQTATAAEPFAEHESDSSNSSIQPSLNPNYDTDSSIPSSECGSITSYSVPSSPVVVLPELPLSDAVKASAVTNSDLKYEDFDEEKNEWNSTLNACSVPASLSSCPIPLPVPLPNDDLRNVCRVIKPLAPRESVQSSESSSPTADILSTTPKSHPKPQSKVNPVPLPAKSAIAAASGSVPARTVITETIGTIIDEQGNKIWICPACTRPDDGSPMIGCDECDDWYHWVCVGIVVPPKEEENWFCSRCIVKKQGLQKKKKKKHRKDKVDV